MNSKNFNSNSVVSTSTFTNWLEIIKLHVGVDKSKEEITTCHGGAPLSPHFNSLLKSLIEDSNFTSDSFVKP